MPLRSHARSRPGRTGWRAREGGRSTRSRCAPRGTPSSFSPRRRAQGPRRSLGLGLPTGARTPRRSWPSPRCRNMTSRHRRPRRRREASANGRSSRVDARGVAVHVTPRGFFVGLPVARRDEGLRALARSTRGRSCGAAVAAVTTRSGDRRGGRCDHHHARGDRCGPATATGGGIADRTRWADGRRSRTPPSRGRRSRRPDPDTTVNCASANAGSSDRPQGNRRRGSSNGGTLGGSSSALSPRQRRRRRFGTSAASAEQRGGGAGHALHARIRLVINAAGAEVELLDQSRRIGLMARRIAERFLHRGEVPRPW